MGAETAGVLQFHYNSLSCHYVVFVLHWQPTINCMMNKQAINSLFGINSQLKLIVSSVQFSEAPHPHRKKYRSSSFASDAAWQTCPGHCRCLLGCLDAHAAMSCSMCMHV